MASSSSSTTPCKYDVFISFRGKDIRKRFLSHLFVALERKQINAFLDENLDKGEDISPALLKIIQESSLSIVIFSENYADSPWCLDELVKILECKETIGQMVLPVFYEVDPTDVQEPRGKFKEAFDTAKRGEQVKGSLQKVDKWKHALMEVSNLSGWDSRDKKNGVFEGLKRILPLRSVFYNQRCQKQVFKLKYALTKLCITCRISYADLHKEKDHCSRTSRKLHKGLHNLCSPLMQSHKEFINELAEDSLNQFLLEHTILGLHVRKML